MTVMNRIRTLVCAALALAMLPAAPAQAQTYPARAIRIIVPFAAASGTDVVARMLGNELSVRMGQAVVIENISAGATIVATQTVARAEPDGYTLFLTTSAHAILPSLHNQLPFDVVKDFTPIMLVCAGPLLLSAHPSFPAKNIQELIALAKSKPGQINYASSGTGTAPHLAVELLKAKTGIDLQHVPYRGGGPAMNDLLGGVVPLYFSGPSTAMPHIQAGTVRALGQSSHPRSALAKDIPSIAEQGVPGYNMELWYALLAPPKTPQPIVERILKEVSEILKKDQVRNNLQTLGFEPKPSNPDALVKHIESELQQWAEVAKVAKLSEQKPQ